MRSPIWNACPMTWLARVSTSPPTAA